MKLSSKKTIALALASAGLLSVFLLMRSGSADAQSMQLSGTTLRVGSRSANVTALQQFLATEPYIYPQGIVSGYFGPLTKNAVMQFQLQYGLSPDGVVGPVTRSMINGIIASGEGINIRVPVFLGYNESVSGHTMTIDISADKPVRAYVYYSTSPITGGDSETPFTLPTVSGTAQSDTNLTSNKHIEIGGLSSNNTYYSVVLIQDAHGNVAARFNDPVTIH
ncbi:MAG TPA: peptidoglycan-binding domain-containing protein [Candidatus Paceibacterota bacterium]|nr:peptidoglycan-binding domain-containing protein [Candidatus Paceibacterota bacterium]